MGASSPFRIQNLTEELAPMDAPTWLESGAR